MTNIDKLITSSPKTLKWLGIVKSRVVQEISSLIYRDSKYWASFRNPETNRNVAYLQPQKNQIRLFTKLNTSFDSSLQMTPSTSQWAESYPSIFLILAENSIDKAVNFIINSYKKDLENLEIQGHIPYFYYNLINLSSFLVSRGILI